jgi:hypothetical protein
MIAMAMGWPVIVLPAFLTVGFGVAGEWLLRRGDRAGWTVLTWGPALSFLLYVLVRAAWRLLIWGTLPELP